MARSFLTQSLTATVAAATLFSCTARKGGGDETLLMSEPMQTKEEPSARGMHTAVWTGEGMLVWGGMIDSGGGDPSTGGAIYYPGSNKWFKLPKHNHDTRYHHSMVWTGIQMIVWGGIEGNFGEPTNTGLMLDNEDDAWFTTSTANAPAPRTGHTAVWTGERMIVWGGELKDSFYNDGGVYDLVADAWEKLPGGDGSPEARAFHTVIWTGKEMIVWGGQNGGNPLSDGAAYDPVKKEWSALSAKGAPRARFSHTAVWTGSKMIVWGGRGEDERYLNDGAVYDPESDSWTALPTSGAPTPRELHSATWTGKQMIIWGGLNAAGAQSGGAVYDPEAKEWERIKTKKRTPSRYMHSGVWTGSELLVWGGRGTTGKFLKKEQGVSVAFEEDAPKTKSKGPKMKLAAKKGKGKKGKGKVVEDKAPKDDMATDAAAYLEELEKSEKAQPAAANSK